MYSSVRYINPYSFTQTLERWTFSFGYFVIELLTGTPWETLENIEVRELNSTIW